MKTTLNQIRAQSPCQNGWKKLLAHLGKTAADDEPLAIVTILDSNDLDDALWCLRAVKGRDREIRLYAVWCARQVQHLMTDPRSLAALEVAERFANGLATESRLAKAWRAAQEAVTSARGSVKWAAEAAADAASAGESATWAAAVRSAQAAQARAWEATRKAQAARLRELCAEIEKETV